jgi:hypothetical protein
MQPRGPNFNLYGLKEMIVAELKIMFYLSYMHPTLRQVKHTKFHQNYYPKLRRNLKAGVLIDQILTTHMNVLKWNLQMLQVRRLIGLYIIFIDKVISQ